MKHKKIHRICWLFLLLLFCNCSYSRNTEQVKAEAIAHYKEYLVENAISPLLFNKPTIDMTNEKYTIYEWKSKIPKDGAVKIRVLVPPKSSDETIVSLKGEEKDWRYILGTEDKLVNQAILSQLFGSNFDDKEEVLKYLKKVDAMTFSSAEQEDLVKFVGVRYAMINYLVKHKKYPESINELKIDSIEITDKWGNQYKYQVQDKFILIGTKGENGIWDVDEMMKATILADMKEFIYRIKDDFIVKFIPITQ